MLQLYSGDVDKQKMLKVFMTYTNCMHFCENCINLGMIKENMKKETYNRHYRIDEVLKYDKYNVDILEKFIINGSI